MSTHTPGPWEVAPTAADGTVRVVADQQLVRICTLTACVGVREERLLANARLLAAAPLLLLALREVADYFDRHCPARAEAPRMLVDAAIRVATSAAAARRDGASVVRE